MTDGFRTAIHIRVNDVDVAHFVALDGFGRMLMSCLHPTISVAVQEVLDTVLSDYQMEDDGDIITLEFTTNP